MARPNNAKVVGGFVVVGVALLIGAIALFGSGALFTRTRLAVAYFDGSVAGLSVGAPVTYRGVPVGHVSRIVLEVSAETGEAHIPVYLEFKPDTISYRDGEQMSEEGIKRAIAHGLRAQLVSQSLITGQLAVQLDYFPGTPIQMMAKHGDTPEIPTVPSTFQEIKNRLSTLPLQAIAESALGSLNSLEKLLRSPETQGAVKNLSTSLEDLRKLTAALSPEVQQTLRQADATLASIRQTADTSTATLNALRPDAQTSLANLAKVMDTAGQQTGPLIAQLRTTAKSIDLLAQSAQGSLFTGIGVLANRSPLRQSAEEMMRNLATASYSLRALAAELERNPNALIMGGSR